MKALVVCKHPNKEDSAKACKVVEGSFEVLHEWKDTLTKANLEDVDVVVGIGGDGTILSASHYVEDELLVGVNSNVNTSEGALSTVTVDNLSEILKGILDKKEVVEKLERIDVLINGKSVGMYALNEVYVGHDKAYRTSKYNLEVNGKSEEQRSSGILVVTGTGSTAWYASAGQKPFDSLAKYLMMFVREPYSGRIYKPTLLREKVDDDGEVKIVPLVPSIVVLDSIREIHVKIGDEIVIKRSSFVLNRVIG